MFSKSKTEKITHLKQELTSRVKDIKAADLLKNIALADYFFRKFKQEDSDIVFQELEQIPKGERIPLPTVKGGAIMTTNKTEDNQRNTLSFETIWTVGATLVMHRHSDCEEEIIVNKGSALAIIINGNEEPEKFTLKEGDKLRFGANIKHQVTALESCDMKVNFYKV